MTSPGDSSPTAERRQRQDLREIFEDVAKLVEPFVQGSGVSLGYWAYRAVRNAYPEVDEQGLRIVVDAALRVSRQRLGEGAQKSSLS